MSGVNTSRIRELLVERQRSARDVSRKAGLGETALKDILMGRNRRPALDTLNAIASQLGVSLAEIADADGSAAPGDRQLVPSFLPVRFKVAAGLWRQVDEYAQDFPEPPQAVVPEPRYGDWPQWLELVEGPSMDLIMRPGSYAHVVDACEMGYAPRSGDVVVVERRRMGGHLRERTLKEVKVTATNVELWPRSSDPRYQTPISLTDCDEGTEVQIVGKVIGAYVSVGRG